ncbi:hypothetical protein SUGI_0258960 [Cryptomeria japonica]|nr:hypothetical protein SUGI_0258960 [Cryptomeria japonica]
MAQTTHILATKRPQDFRLYASATAEKNCIISNRLPYSGSSTILTVGNGHSLSLSVHVLPICRNNNRSRIYNSKIDPTYYTQEFRERSSANEIYEEIKKCYQLVHRLGRGVVYLGSSRTKEDHPHFLQAMELGRETADLLGCTSWTGAGPGLMDAVTKGALKAEKPVGGLKIAQEAGEWTSSNFHPYLPSETYLTCRFFSARKHGLVDAAMRNNLVDHTAIIGLPGGIGSLDEIFEILTLFQLERIGSKYPVPFILISYDGFYSKLLDFLDSCKQWGTVSDGEVDSLWKVCKCNLEALEYLADFYNIHEDKRKFRGRLEESYAKGD